MSLYKEGYSADNAVYLGNLNISGQEHFKDRDIFVYSEPDQPIDFSVNLGRHILSYITERPYRKNVLPRDATWSRTIYKFLLSLDAYHDAKGIIPCEEILQKTLLHGPEYASYLKDLRKFAFFNQRGNYFLGDIESQAYKDSKSLKIKDVGDIFNYQYLPFWREEIDDYKKGFEEVKLDQEILIEFRQVLERIIPVENIDFVREEEVLLSVSGSSTFSKSKVILDKSQINHSRAKKKLKKRLIKKEKLKKKNKFNSKIGLCRRSVIPICAGNFRDSVILSVQSLNTVQLIDRRARQVLEYMDGHIHLSDENRIRRRLAKLDKYYNFFDRDLTKEGITKPREIVQIILEVLNSKYPGKFQYTDFYSDFHLQLETGEIVYPCRGHGLGMANALTTIMQLGIFYMNLFRCHVDASCIVLNDDFTAGFDNREDFIEYFETEDDILEGLGLLRKLNKSFHSKNMFVIAERYYPEEYNKKESYRRSEILRCLDSINVTHAKMNLSGVAIQSDYVSEYLPEFIHKFGYEFFKDEANYPATMGGWVNSYIGSTDLNLVRLEDLEFSSKVYAAYIACQEKVRPKTLNVDVFGPAIDYLYRTFDEEHRNVLNFLDLGQILMKFDREPKETYYHKLLQARMKKYNSLKGKEAPPYKSFIEDYCVNSEKDVLNPYPRYSYDYDFYNSDMIDVYQNPNNITDLISFINSKGSAGDNYAWRGISQDVVKISSSNDERRRFRTNLNKAYSNISLDDSNKLYREFVLPREDYIELYRDSLLNMASYARASVLIHKRLVEPLIPSKYCVERKNVFGFSYTVFDWLDCPSLLDFIPFFLRNNFSELRGREVINFFNWFETKVYEKTDQEDEDKDIEDDHDYKDYDPDSKEEVPIIKLDITTLGVELDEYDKIILESKKAKELNQIEQEAKEEIPEYSYDDLVEEFTAYKRDRDFEYNNELVRIIFEEIDNAVRFSSNLSGEDLYQHLGQRLARDLDIPHSIIETLISVYDEEDYDQESPDQGFDWFENG